MRSVEIHQTILYNLLKVIEMLDPKIIGENVRQIRKEKMGQTQESFAESINTSKDTVSNIERGSVIPTTQTLANIAEYSGVSITPILGIKEPE